MENTQQLKSKKNNQRIAQSFGCMEVDKILYIKTLSTMNITKLTFLLRRKLRNSLIFRNFTILSAAIILFPSGVFAQEGNVSIHIKNGTVKTFMKQVEQQTRYTFVYRNHVLNDQTKVTISCTKKPISEALSFHYFFVLSPALPIRWCCW